MSVLGVLEKLRLRKSEAVADVWSTYRRDVLGPLAAGQEIDVDLVESMLEQLGKSEVDLQREVAELQKRQSLAEQVKLAKANALKLAKVESEIETLDREFAAIREQYAAKLTPLRSQLGILASSSDPNIYADQLRRSIMDPKLKQALADNLEARRKIGPRMEAIRFQLHRNADADGLSTLKWRIDSIRNDIANIETPKSTIRRYADELLNFAMKDATSIDQQRKLAEMREKLEPLLEQEKKLVSELDDLERQLSDLQAEERRLHSLCLEP